MRQTVQSSAVTFDLAGHNAHVHIEEGEASTGTITLAYYPPGASTAATATQTYTVGSGADYTLTDVAIGRIVLTPDSLDEPVIANVHVWD